MIGNDIVDLTLAQNESNWQRKGFLDKIFTAHEQQLIRTATDPDQMVWLLWSMKESAYKIAVRDSGKRCFAPIKLACHLTEWNDKSAKGMVCYEKIYQTQSSLNAQYIATVAVSDKHQRLDHIIVPLHVSHYLHQHQILWKKIKQHCVATWSIPKEKIHFHKDEASVPWMSIRPTLTTTVKVPLSVSHHGWFGAFVIGGKLSFQSAVHSSQYF